MTKAKVFSSHGAENNHVKTVENKNNKMSRTTFRIGNLDAALEWTISTWSHAHGVQADYGQTVTSEVWCFMYPIASIPNWNSPPAGAV